MKQLIIFSLLFSQLPNLNSQDYVPMAVDSATWVMVKVDPNPYWSESIILRIEGDTIINNLEYFKIYHYDIHLNEVLVNTRKLLGLIRDEVDQKKVYGVLLGGIQFEFDSFLSINSQCDWGEANSFNEHLLYDFSLQEGDTISSCMFPFSTSISSVETKSCYGFQRRSFNLNDSDFSIMTEGIGTCMGIFRGEQCYITGYDSYYLENYCIGSFSNCNVITTIKVEDFPTEIIIHPNPVTSDLFVATESIIKKLSLFDFHGRLLSSNDYAKRIEMSNFNSGIYILKIEDEGGNCCTKKVIKK